MNAIALKPKIFVHNTSRRSFKRAYIPIKRKIITLNKRYNFFEIT